MTVGIDTPDNRGRTGLDQHGRDLTGNPRVRIHAVEVLSCHWYVLRNTTFDYQHSDGHWSREQRETYDRGDGAGVGRPGLGRHSAAVVACVAGRVVMPAQERSSAWRFAVVGSGLAKTRQYCYFALKSDTVSAVDWRIG